MNVCALTSAAMSPASRFRIRQHIEPLRHYGVNVTDYCPWVRQAMPMPGPLSRMRRRYVAPAALAWTAAHAVARTPAVLASWRSDLVWISRRVVPGLDEVVHLLRRPRVLDMDDAIWLEGVTGWSASTTVRAVDAVIAGNRYLAEWAKQYCDTVHVVPTAVDCNRFRPQPRPPSDRSGRFVIGWTGSAATLRYLEQIQSALATVIRANPGASLLVVADSRPRMPALDGLPFRFLRWSPETEVEALEEMDVGIMPLPDDEFARGKCSFKMLQYMAAGLPSVVSPVGMNRALLGAGEIGLAASTPSEWIDALTQLHDAPGLRARMGCAGRQLAEREFDVEVISGKLAAIFKGLG